ncbi:MAG TPA: RagB/SusD family nutrient uptake outer membrane protein [Puia sp.]|nr:RagB/SusD family nutrient uptake outer membrane protein [Puia sp.]
MALALAALLFSACSKNLLTETSRSTFTPDYFKTADGVQSGLTALYQNLRQVYGGYYYSACETGTDEYTWGNSADNNFKDIDFTPNVGNGVTASSSRSDVLWNSVFTNINTANGILQYGSAAGVASSLTSEARFFRAFEYFQLVQTFGGVPLDLGAGELQFNTSAVSTSVRNTVPEVYAKAIIPDLLAAADSLPVNPRLTGTVTQTVARLFLSKAYLTYAWWLQNPNNIPTYPETSRTDPAGHDAAYYFQQAYNVATAAMANPGPYGLQPTYYDVNVASNDRNSEELLYADHIGQNEYYNQGNESYGVGVGSPANDACWLALWNYGLIAGGVPVQREETQALGRPWSRMATPVEVFTKTFADKTNDSRYDGTFTTVYRGNWNKAGASAGTINTPTLSNANGLTIHPGDPVLSFLDADNGSVSYPSDSKGASSVGAGTLPGRADYVVEPSAISRGVCPNLWKTGPRSLDPTSLGQPNGDGDRPWVIAKFSEFFFIAAEAAVKGASTQAVSGTYANDGTANGLINVIRARAGVWKFSNAQNQTVTADYSAAMVAATPATIDINYILAERSREYFGEGYRWFDLVRTQTWAQIAATYSICESPSTNTTNHTLVTYTRTPIDLHYYLRPIPQSQLDRMTVDNATKAAYQNPGY